MWVAKHYFHSCFVRRCFNDFILILIRTRGDFFSQRRSARDESGRYARRNGCRETIVWRGFGEQRTLNPTYVDAFI